MPWWGALLIAVGATVIGYGIDAGHKDLTHVFAACYIAGCVIAVLAVRQSGVFTAVIQPPLILFCAVPGAYWLFHGGKIDKLKDLLINCGYPLIERFPLMLGTAGVVLLIGLARWYFGITHRPAADADGKADTTPRAESNSLFSGIAAKFATMLNSSDDDEDEDVPSRPRTARRNARTSPRTGRAARNTRSAQRPDRTRSRHSRAGEDPDNPTAERRQGRRSQQRPRDFDAADPPRRSRRPRPQGEPDPRDRRSQREGRRDSYGRRGSYERPPRSRLDPYESYEPPPEQFSRYESYESYEPPRRRATPAGPQSTNPTHHPISQVRYRGSRDERPDDPRAERRGRPGAPRRQPAESWEYDF